LSEKVDASYVSRMVNLTTLAPNDRPVRQYPKLQFFLPLMVNFE